MGPQDSCEFASLEAVTPASDGTNYVSTENSEPALFKIETQAQSIEFHEAISSVTTTTGLTNPVANFNTSQLNKLCPKCPVQVVFGGLTEVNIDFGSYKSRPIDVFVEDQYNPGTFFFNSAHAIMKLTSNGTVEHLLGDLHQSRKPYAPGNSTTARFALISSILQYNETILLIADYLNSCVREYNFERDGPTYQNPQVPPPRRHIGRRFL